MPAAQAGETLDFIGMMQMPRAQFIGFANNHSMHHRGQLAAYLRAMGSKVPNIYGPSADARTVIRAFPTCDRSSTSSTVTVRSSRWTRPWTRASRSRKSTGA